METPTRGIVTAASISYQPDGSAIVSHRIDPLELRRYVLYWDKIAWAILRGPTDEIIVEKGSLHVDYIGPDFGPITRSEGAFISVGTVGDEPFGGNRDLKLLQEESIVESYEVEVHPSQLSSEPGSEPRLNLYGFRGSQINEAVWIAKVNLLKALYRQSPSYFLWSIGHDVERYGRELLLKTGRPGDKETTVAIDIPSVLPVPADDVPLEDILEFKRKRRPELLRFRLALVEFYESIAKNPENRFLQEKAVNEIEYSLFELKRLFDEHRLKRLFASFTSVLSIDIENVIAFFSHGGILSFLLKAMDAKIDVRKSNIPKIRDLPSGHSPLDYLYLYYIERKYQRKRNPLWRKWH